MSYHIQLPGKLASRQYYVGVGTAQALVDTPRSQIVDLGGAEGSTADIATLSSSRLAAGQPDDELADQGGDRAGGRGAPRQVARRPSGQRRPRHRRLGGHRYHGDRRRPEGEHPQDDRARAAVGPHPDHPHPDAGARRPHRGAPGRPGRRRSSEPPRERRGHRRRAGPPARRSPQARAGHRGTREPRSREGDGDRRLAVRVPWRLRHAARRPGAAQGVAADRRGRR